MSADLELASPSHLLGDSYRGLVAEFVERREQLIPFVLDFDHADLDAMLSRLADYSRGVGLPSGFVSHSTYWLVESHSEVVAVANLRHALTPALRREGGNIGYGVRPSARGRGLGTATLSLSLRRAREMGLTQVLLTCGKENVASRRVILRNGGVLDSEEYLPDRGEIVQRYLISLATRDRA
jgi:predicted acetyltransferase